ncbi:prephenate dehydratase [Fimbriiglobus ruber]|uniref:prephenate dehydratase n=1 Tax=Fimbriiglobus ruber TaxID=1908690 RepID=UPI001EE69AC7|nr:prephenate dehydratase [Fimbriiglobus ruber]
MRAQIDKFDLQILETLNKRAAIAAQIGKIKSEIGGEVFNASREEEVLSNVLGANKGPLKEVTVKGIFRELMSGCRALQGAKRVAFLGPEYSYSHLAALERFGGAIEYVRVGSIPAVFEEVGRRHVDYGLVPLENSTDGRIADTLDSFVRLPQVRICSEIRLRVRHHLLANCEQTAIRKVYSKAQALSQCRHWLGKNLPHATTHEVSSTADAARLVQTDPHAAAVASRQAAVRYNLRVLFSNIEDQPDNETRFAVIALHDSPKTGNDKTAVMFQTQHSPGALADVLSVFKQNKINLTWIESFPYKDVKGEYVFFVDFDGHNEDAKVKKALKSLEAVCDPISVIGSFPAAKLTDE